MEKKRNKIKTIPHIDTTGTIKYRNSIRSPLSPTSFNVYKNQIITEWKEEDIKGEKFQEKKKLRHYL